MRIFIWKNASVASRVAFSLVSLSTFALMSAYPLGLWPDVQEMRIREKSRLCETLAISCSILAQRGEQQGLEDMVGAFAQRHTDVRSVCVRRSDGRVLHQIGDHNSFWHLAPDAPSTRDNVSVPINTSEQANWGTVELSFAQPSGSSALVREHPLVCMTLFTVFINGLLFRWFMGRVLTYLDPAKAVPTHVRSTLDTFAEGVVVLDNQRRIVLANESFAEQVGKDANELQGHVMDRFPWRYDDPQEGTPWDVRADHDLRTGWKLGLRGETDEERTFLVNMSAIKAEDGRQRGAIASFDDITLMEQKKRELSRMLNELQTSRDELSLRNEELQYLATRDPLTGSLNRRTFFESFDDEWRAAHRHRHPLSCIMVDVDHFKSVNDNHGHGIGDEVLREVAATIAREARAVDIVCRYGGEEFCLLMPRTDLEEAFQAAERIRLAIAAIRFEKLTVTASLGVSALSMGAGDPQELIDQADKSLYVAKRAGRNQVMRWDEAPHEDEAVEQAPRSGDEETKDQSIPYAAVASLLSALAYRDADTAAHSTRVAELCVATGRGLLSVREAYVLEIAALLHDIGKVGVPDAILLKPGPLTKEEWETMKIHDRIGVEIVEASFSNPQLVDIVRYHHATYSGSPDAPHMPSGKDIPLGARIVTIADAYDAMVSDRVYRKGRSPEEAFAELRRCAGRQFDPDLVERFINVAEDFKSLPFYSSSKQSALQIGLQIERLAQAVDDRDKVGIQALAKRLGATASHCGVPEVELIAAEIQELAGDDAELVTLVEMVNQLIDLSQSIQKVYIHVGSPSQTPAQTAASRPHRESNSPARPDVVALADGGIALTQHGFESRENRITLTAAQRQQAGRLLTQHKRGLLTRAEHRLDDESSDGDGVLLRFTTEGDVNLTQIDGCQDDVNVIFDSAVGLQSWATLVDEPMTQVT